MDRIYFASNRNVIHETSSKAKNLGDRFNADGPQFFRVGWVQAHLSGNDPKMDNAWSAGRCELYPERLAPGRGSDVKIGSSRLFEDLRRYLTDNDCDVVIYIHGFASTFANSAIRASALERLYGDLRKPGSSDLMVVMFSWPSNGNVFPSYEYFSDREDAEASGVAMARALQRFVEFLVKLRNEDRATLRDFANRGEVPPPELLKQCNRKIHLLAHSMGTFAFRHAVVKYVNLIGQQKLPRILDNVFLMASDEDADALQNTAKLSRLPELADAVHVYHSAGDRALQISDTTKGNPARLGADGPANFGALNERIFAVDCRNVDVTVIAHGNHQYYRLRDEVMADVVQTLDNVSLDGREGRITLLPGRHWRLKSQD